MLAQLLAVGCGGFLGAISRFLISGWAHRAYGGLFPIGTFLVNVLGCLLIGSLMTLVETREWFTPPMRLLLITGFLGSLTTFSTFGYETFDLMTVGRFKLASAYVAANVFLGLGALWLSRTLTLMVASPKG